MQFIVFLLAAFLMGAITPIYLPMNSSVARYVGSPILANMAFFFMGLATTLIALSITLLLTANTDGLAIAAKFRNVPIYLYLSGVFSALLILGTSVLIPRLGASTFFVLFVLGQVVMAAVVSHLGILESPKDPISLQKIVGIIFLITGVGLTTFSHAKEISWLPTVFKSVRASFWGT
ncbi:MULTISPECIES: DMT family transporter [unclassified Anabaena]|uniref:DMT family transporter n=1 Tax=unclassified Anabaena TaxID=2619674 RepID=UPI0039C6C979